MLPVLKVMHPQKDFAVEVQYIHDSEMSVLSVNQKFLNQQLGITKLVKLEMLLLHIQVNTGEKNSSKQSVKLGCPFHTDITTAAFRVTVHSTLQVHTTDTIFSK